MRRRKILYIWYVIHKYEIQISTHSLLLHINQWFPRSILTSICSSKLNYNWLQCCFSIFIMLINFYKFFISHSIIRISSSVLMWKFSTWFSIKIARAIPLQNRKQRFPWRQASIKKQKRREEKSERTKSKREKSTRRSLLKNCVFLYNSRLSHSTVQYNIIEESIEEFVYSNNNNYLECEQEHCDLFVIMYLYWRKTFSFIHDDRRCRCLLDFFCLDSPFVWYFHHSSVDRASKSVQVKRLLANSSVLSWRL